MSSEAVKKLFLASPSGFCGGVRRAVEAFEAARRQYGAPIFVLHELVHNRHVTAKLAEAGAIFIAGLDAAPEGAAVLFGAHGVPDSAYQTALRKHLRVIDATCPLVRKLQDAAAAIATDAELVILGHRGHPEVEGVIGHAGTSRIFPIASADDVAELPELRQPTLLVQTTLNYHETAAAAASLARRFPRLRRADDICSASRQRQYAVEAISRLSEFVIIIGSSHSSNANRLTEAARQSGARSILIDSIGELPESEFTTRCVGLSAGASTPDELISEAVSEFVRHGYEIFDTPATGVPERKNFEDIFKK